MKTSDQRARARSPNNEKMTPILCCKVINVHVTRQLLDVNSNP